MSSSPGRPIYEMQRTVNFGDCDPVGIVYYPHIFSWCDDAFHAYLRAAGGGHAALCRVLQARGIGLIQADCRFRAPVREEDNVTVEIAEIAWRDRSFQIDYRGRVGDDVVFDGQETRVIFIEGEGRMRAGDTKPLQERLSREA